MYPDTREYKPTKFDANYYGEQVEGNPAALGQLGQLNLFRPPQPPPFAPIKTEMIRPLVPKGTELVSVEELEELKENINDSFSETVNLYLELRRDIDMILERLDIHNRRASHKI
jgi:hypothetical protein